MGQPSTHRCDKAMVLSSAAHLNQGERYNDDFELLFGKSYLKMEKKIHGVFFFFLMGSSGKDRGSSFLIFLHFLRLGKKREGKKNKRSKKRKGQQTPSERNNILYIVQFKLHINVFVLI